MDLFKKKKRVIEVGGQKIELEPKPTKSPFSIGKKQKPQAPSAQAPPPQRPAEQSMELNKIEYDLGVKPEQEKKPTMNFFSKKPAEAKPQKGPEIKLGEIKTQKLEFPEALTREAPRPAAPGAPGAKRPGGKPSPLANYLQKTLSKQKGLVAALREQGIKTEPYDFVKRMFLASVALSIVIGITIFVLFQTIGLLPVEALLFGFVLGIAIFQFAFRSFLQFPLAKAKATSKNVEKDILFAARDLIISLRSGMPLFNAITSVSKGYGDASLEFAKIVDRVQLGMPLEEAIDDTISVTKSQSFKRIMLQASVSIKAGADVVGALQSVIDQLSQERIIELRSYGQRLNAIAMFYMLFGIILPSMGIAVVTILTTFIALFTVDVTVFEFVLVGIIALQLIFLKLITGSRPVFTL